MSAFFYETNLLTVSEAKALSEPIVYALCDQAGAAFYVGKTTQPKHRFASHGNKRGGLNAQAAARYRELGASMRVSVLRVEPSDLDAAECEEIVRRPWCRNVVVPGHWRWARPHIALPGVFAGLCPSAHALKRLKKAKEPCEDVREAVSNVDPRFRFEFEIGAYCDLPIGWRWGLEEWAQCVMVAAPEVPHLLWHAFLVAHGEAKASAAYVRGACEVLKEWRHARA